MTCSNSTSHDWQPVTVQRPANGTFIHQDFYSVYDWLGFLETPMDLPLEQSTSHASGWKLLPRYIGDTQVYRGERWKSWSATETFEEAMRLAEAGWPEGLNEVNKYAAELSDELMGLMNIPEVRYDVVGEELDVGRFVNDEPEQYMSLLPEETEREPMLLKMAVNFGASQGVPTTSMIKRGAAVVALIDVLERQGKRIQLDAIACAYNDLDVWRRRTNPGYGNPRTEYYRRGTFDAPAFGIQTRIRLKEFSWPLQLANLVYVLAHPSAHRRLAFCSWEHTDERMRQHLGIYKGGEYGYPADLSEEEQEDFDIYIPSLSTVTRMGPERAVQYVLDSLKQQGVFAEQEVQQV